MNLTATIERAEDGSYTATAVVGEHTVIGDGETRDEAVSSLRAGAIALVEHLKAEGKPLPQLVTVEVAA